MSQDQIKVIVPPGKECLVSNVSNLKKPKMITWGPGEYPMKLIRNPYGAETMLLIRDGKPRERIGLALLYWKKRIKSGVAEIEGHDLSKLNIPREVPKPQPKRVRQRREKEREMRISVVKPLFFSKKTFRNLRRASSF